MAVVANAFADHEPSGSGALSLEETLKSDMAAMAAMEEQLENTRRQRRQRIAGLLARARNFTGGRAPAMDDRLNGHMAEMGGGPAANDGSQLFHHGGAAMPAVSGIFSSADMASGPSGQDDWERGAGSAVSAPVDQLRGHVAATFDARPNGHGAEMGGGPAAGDVSDLFRAGGAAMPAVSGLFSSADMASGPSGQDDWERGAGSAISAPAGFEHPGGHAAATFAARPNGHGAEMGGGPAAGDVSDLFRAGGAAMPAVSGLFSSADMASGPSGQDDWERGAGSAASASAAQPTTPVDTSSWFDQGAGGGQLKDVSSLFADDPESVPAQASQAPPPVAQAAQPTTSVDTSSWFDQGAGGGQPKDVSSLFADDPESVPAQASQAPPPVAQAAQPTTSVDTSSWFDQGGDGGQPKDVSSLFADDPGSVPAQASQAPPPVAQAAQPTTSVDTSSWLDQGAGGGQPKDVSSLFADDPESVPAQASQAPPPVAQAQAAQPTSVDTSSWFDQGGDGGQPKDVSSLFADDPGSVPAQASQAPPPVAQAAQPTTSVDTSSWFDQGAGGGQPKDVSSLFADDRGSVPAQASHAPPPVAQVGRANGSDHEVGCANGKTNDVSSLFADDASPGLFASVAAPAAPDPFAGPTVSSWFDQT